jgi:hypothetical protein
VHFAILLSPLDHAVARRKCAIAFTLSVGRLDQLRTVLGPAFDGSAGPENLKQIPYLACLRKLMDRMDQRKQDCLTFVRAPARAYAGNRKKAGPTGPGGLYLRK